MYTFYHCKNLNCTSVKTKKNHNNFWIYGSWALLMFCCYTCNISMYMIVWCVCLVLEKAKTEKKATGENCYGYIWMLLCM